MIGAGATHGIEGTMQPVAAIVRVERPSEAQKLEAQTFGGRAAYVIPLEQVEIGEVGDSRHQGRSIVRPFDERVSSRSQSCHFVSPHESISRAFRVFPRWHRGVIRSSRDDA